MTSSKQRLLTPVYTAPFVTVAIILLHYPRLTIAGTCCLIDFLGQSLGWLGWVLCLHVSLLVCNQGIDWSRLGMHLRLD